MNILMVGLPHRLPGSWDIRGLQLGQAIGARATSAPTASDWKWADVAVLVKRAAEKFAPAAHRARVPIVWDALDFWSQPADNGLDEAGAMARLEAQVQAIQPALTLGATQAMATAAGGAYLPHHSWRGLEPMQARETDALVVGYQGNRNYLGKWEQPIVEACQRRGWTTRLDPDELWHADILVAFREGQWDGFMCRSWKSGVKLVNAIAAGRPVITKASAAMAELQAPGCVIDSIDQIDEALDAYASVAARRRVVDECRSLAPAYRLPAVAERYREILSSVRTTCTA